MTEWELADLVIDKILVPRGWERVSRRGYDPSRGVRLRRRHDPFCSTEYVWLDPKELLLGSFDKDGISPVFDIEALYSPELKKFRSGFSSTEELQLELTVAGLI